MDVDLGSLSPNSRYHLITQTLIPRPIAWVLTQNDSQVAGTKSYNLAPFSFFNALCSDPPLVMLSIGHKSADQPKDTRRNLLENKEMVIHLPCAAQAADVTASAASLGYGDSELKQLQAGDLVEFAGCPLPRLRAAPVAFYARFYEVHYLGPARQAIIYAELLRLYVKDEAVVHDSDRGRFQIDASALDPLARLGGAQYAGLGKPFTLKRPE